MDPFGTLPKHNWPQGPRSLSGKLRRMAPALRGLGVVVEFPPSTARRMVRIEKLPSSPLAEGQKNARIAEGLRGK